MKNAILMVLGQLLVAQLIAASLGWLDTPSFSSPSNTDNVCTKDQKQGFNWSDLNVGKFSAYKEISFHGFSLSNEFNFGDKNRSHGTHDHSFSEKYITGLALHDELKTPRFGLSPSIEVSSFSITKIFVSVEFDCDLEFHYAMLDNSVCKQRVACSKDGSIIENTQCGGATSVTVLYPKQTSVIENDKQGCNFGFHSIEFDCNPANSAILISSTSTISTVTATATQIGTLPISNVGKKKKDNYHDDDDDDEEEEEDDDDDDDDENDDDEKNKKEESKKTKIIEILPEVSLVPIPKPIPRNSISTEITTITTSPPSITTAPCPGILPACLNTWKYSIGCSSNTDVACFCPSSKFSSSIYSCIEAHAKFELEMRVAKQYYQGICVNYISTNPNIVDAALPFVSAPLTNITLINGGSVSNISPIIPITVIEIIITDSITYSAQPRLNYISKSITVPEVIFSTVTSMINNKYFTDVGLVPASPTKAIETINWPKNLPSQVTGSLYPPISDGSRVVATFCVLGAAFIFAAAIAL
ncbi:hypothetical protein HI914_00785 [Erysiphe necator]|nr:hypothetical protein HI914_00785 [Erysiphe necator]